MLTDAGRQYFADLAAGTIAQEAFDLGLYTAIAGGWSNATVFADLTEMAVAGYARQTLAGLAAAAMVGGIAVAEGTTMTFSNASGADDTALGYFWFGAVSGTFLGGFDFPSPVVIEAGLSRQVKPSVQVTTL